MEKARELNHVSRAPRETSSALTRPLPLPSNQSPLLTLVWIKDDRRKQDARKTVENMLRHACGPYGQTAIIDGDAQLAWSVLLPEKFTPLTCWSIYTNGAELCLIEGDMHEDLPRVKLLPGDNPGLAHFVATHMRAHPERRLKDLIGVYGGIYVDRHRSCAYVFGDPTGTRPIFWLSDAQRFVVTGNLWAFRGCDGFSRHWDTMALMEMLTIGFPMAGRTWLSGVSILQRGRQVCSFANGRTTVRMLLEPVLRQPWSIKQSVHMLRESMDQTVKRLCHRLNRPVGLGLSGGLDSRLLLASLYTQNLDQRNYTFCLRPEEADNQIAQSIARLLDVPHKTFVLDSPVAITHRDYRLINEGESPGFGYLLMAAYAQQDVQTLIIGYPADVYAGAPLGPFQSLFLKSKQDLAKRVLQASMSLFSAEQAQTLLAPQYRVSWQDILEEWFDSFEQIEQQSIMDVYLDHMTDYRLQRRTRVRIESMRWFCLPIYPYMDERLYTTYRSLPLAHLDGERAHCALLCDYKTGLENLPYAGRSFAGIPIYKEYHYRHAIHFGRVIRQKVVLPLRRKWQETKGIWGFGRNILNPAHEAELRRLEQCPLFHWPAVQNLVERAKCGAFVNPNAIRHLINAPVIHDFLFGSGFSDDHALQFLEPLREIHFVRPTTRPNLG